jgi:hypothetical protein
LLSNSVIRKSLLEEPTFHPSDPFCFHVHPSLTTDTSPGVGKKLIVLGKNRSCWAKDSCLSVTRVYDQLFNINLFVCTVGTQRS